jgi:peptide/nickel transport system substrate-binding protein
VRDSGPRQYSGRLASLLAGLVVVASACGGQSSNPVPTKPQSGGDLTIARVADSQSMDKTTVFDNESIWVFEQMFEMLYEVSPDGKSVQPWLATSYDLSPDQLSWTFHLRPNVKFSTGALMTSADVKFSIDEARSVSGGWQYLDAAIKSIDAPDPATVVIHTSYPWAPLLADIALFANGIVPNHYGGMTKDQFYKSPVATGPFKWDHWTKGQEIKLVKNPNYWQPGKPYLDSVTWTVVGDDNTRILQLKGGQINVDEFPPWSSVSSLQSTNGIVMGLFPSTRTDYLLLNEKVKPFQDVHVRRAISYAIDRDALVKAVLFKNGKAANSFMPPQVPYYDPQSPGLQFDLTKAKQEMALSSVPNGFATTLKVGSGVVVENSIAQILQQELSPLGITVTLAPVDPSTEFTDIQAFNYKMGFSYWTMDIADPDELVTFAVDPGGGAFSFYTNYSNPDVTGWTHDAEKSFDTAQRQTLYSKIQAQSAQDAFMGFLYYSPYAYAYTSKTHGLLVYPTGNYHLEDVWLSH